MGIKGHMHSWCLGQCCSVPGRSLVMFVGDEVDRVSATLALIASGIKPGSRRSLVGRLGKGQEVKKGGC